MTAVSIRWCWAIRPPCRRFAAVWIGKCGSRGHMPGQPAKLKGVMHRIHLRMNCSDPMSSWSAGRSRK